MSKYLVLSLLSLHIVPDQVYAYPSSVTLTTDVVFADILADIPFISVGIFAFGVFTFFFVMRRINNLTIYIHLSVILAFLAAVFDLSRIIQRGYWAMTYDQDVSSVKTLVILRELGHALSFGMRYLFFWAFASEPPRGELPFLPIPDDRRPNFISLDSQSGLHSGNWARWSYLSILLKWSLLFMALAVSVLQILWRLLDALQSCGPIFITEEIFQITLSAIFILKLIVNTFMSPLTPRWKTLRDYSPVILALSAGMGVAIGNIVLFKFSETTLGRFLQAVEFYILILFVLISAFYKMPVRSSVVAELVRRRVTAAGLGDIEADSNTSNTRQSQFFMYQAPGLLAANYTQRKDSSSKRSDHRSITQRISSSSIFPSRILSRRQVSGQIRGSQIRGLGIRGDEGDQRRLWDRDQAEQAPSPGDQGSFRASPEETPNQTPVAEARDASCWRDAVYTSVVRDEQGAATRVSDFPAAKSRKGEDERPPTPQTVEGQANEDASLYTTDLESRHPSIEPPGPAYTRSVADSPVYGLDGIIRNLQIGPADGALESNVSSARSSGMESLIRQQQELDKSIAGLRSFSPSSNRRSLSRMQSDSLQSAFSLSHFPEPPFFAKSSKSNSTVSGATGLYVVEEDAVSVPETLHDHSKNSFAISAISDNSLIVDDVPFQLIPPRMPSVQAELSARPQNQSVPSIARESLDSVFDAAGPSRAVRLGSQGTQYDVTSFIGGLTTPAANRISPLVGIVGRERSMDSESDSVVPATITELTHVQIVDKRRASDEASIADSGIGEDLILPRSNNAAPPLFVVPPAPTVTPPEPELQVQPIRPLLLQGNLQLGLGRGRGLPSGPRGRLEISNPVPRGSGVLNERVAFRRPRPAPLVLQDSNDPRPPLPSVPPNGGYF